jgi:hypothetical protein
MKTLLISTIFLTNSALAASTLALYTSPSGLDWSSPGKIFSTLLKKDLFSAGSPFGMTITEINCPDQKEILTIIPGGLGIFGSLFFEGRGLGFFYQTFPGKVTDASEDLKKILLDEKTRFVKIEINPAQCSRIKDYLSDFRAKKIGERFGLPHRPLMAEGSSDTSLPVSLMEVAGVLDHDQREAWETAKYLPEKLSGVPLKDQYVGFYSLIGSSWGKGPDKSFILKFWDPNRISAWVDNYQGQKIKSEKAVGVVIKKDHLPAPQGTYWQQANDPQYSKKK